MGDIKISYFNKPRRNSIGRRIPRNTPCGYCFEKWATCWDHIIPYSLGGPTNTDNLMPACRACNAMLSDKVFDSIEEKREYVRVNQQPHRIKDFPKALITRLVPDFTTAVSSGMTTFFFTDVRSY
jgi:hypothetical protein